MERETNREEYHEQKQEQEQDHKWWEQGRGEEMLWRSISIREEMEMKARVSLVRKSSTGAKEGNAFTSVQILNYFALIKKW